jgi:hypothetical protein
MFLRLFCQHETHLSAGQPLDNVRQVGYNAGMVTKTRSGKLSVSLGTAMTTWLRRSAARSRITVSCLVRRLLQPAFDRRAK